MRFIKVWIHLGDCLVKQVLSFWLKWFCGLRPHKGYLNTFILDHRFGSIGLRVYARV